MAQFKVYRNQRRSQQEVPFLLDVQSDLVQTGSRLVIPLVRADRYGLRYSRMNPTFTIDGLNVVAAVSDLSAIDERMLQAGEFEMRLQPGESWQAVGAVQKDRPIRIRVSGDYRFQASGSVTADGVTGDDPQSGIVSQIPFGAVMGVIIPANQSADAKPPRPFLVGSTFNRNAERDGVLHLRTNIPTGTKCTGRLDLLVSGPQQ